jgi:hypothetical protein
VEIEVLKWTSNNFMPSSNGNQLEYSAPVSSPGRRRGGYSSSQAHKMPEIFQVHDSMDLSRDEYDPTT